MQNSNGKTALGLDANLGSLICYLNICLPFGLIYSIIVLVTDKTNKLPRFHAFQALLLIGAGFVLGFALGIVFGVFGAVTGSSLISLLGSGVGMVIGLGIFVVGLIAGIKGYGGEMFKLPIIGDMADKWSN
jgi:uncharacterized membrane protein